ncbi:unnamed protein product [Sphagnum jensenii]|uniref:Uncharacterized protein n=1 Tax=Sphagnum jensenii TaxID=128206 RepID=A0ABP0VBQ3_9BRYO
MPLCTTCIYFSYGCEDHAITYYTTNSAQSSTVLGRTYYCGAFDLKPVCATVYFLFFITLTARCVVPVYIGALSMTMEDSMYEAPGDCILEYKIEQPQRRQCRRIMIRKDRDDLWLQRQ